MVKTYESRFPPSSNVIGAVPCSLTGHMLGGAGLGFGMMGKLGREWVGAWLVHDVVPGVVHV